MEAIITVGTTSVFPFFGGEKLLVLTAPDDPNNDGDSLINERYWDVEVKNAGGEELGTSSTDEDATADDLWSEVKDVFFRTVSSNEIARRTTRVQAWIEQVVEDYQARLQEPIPLPTCGTSPMNWSDFVRLYAFANSAYAAEAYPDIAAHLRNCESHRRALIVFHTLSRTRPSRR